MLNSLCRIQNDNSAGIEYFSKYTNFDEDKLNTCISQQNIKRARNIEKCDYCYFMTVFVLVRYGKGVE